MIGQTIEILRHTQTGVDEFNEPIMNEVVEQVDDVLVAPAMTTDLAGNLRPVGDKETIELHFPKSFTGTLRNTCVRVNGKIFDVQGNPSPYMTENTPTRWWLRVQAVRVDG
ncbi:MAG: hypothetical protein PUK59_04565 [Actinomycetaceae bacterium]|nr:hypothetical protein [Actinomycetaceae bacterium]MDY5273653.1 hypothetical protein [Arcanobacterium sp.]